MGKFKTYYEDTDASWRVYYANYLKYLERGRTDFLYNLNLSHNELENKFDIIFVVKNCNINFIHPAYFEDLILIETKIINSTKVKIIFKQKIFKQDQLLIEADVTIVSINKKGKISSMPNSVLQVLKKY